MFKTHKPQPRDNGYYEALLKKKKPLIYQKWRDKKFANLRQALIAAKIKRETTALDLMLRGWNKATVAEKRAFRDLVHSEEADEMVDLLADLDMTVVE